MYSTILGQSNAESVAHNCIIRTKAIVLPTDLNFMPIVITFIYFENAKLIKEKFVFYVPVSKDIINMIDLELWINNLLFDQVMC